ncbi:AAA family ATPase [Pseudomonas sp. PS02290]|uniref:AAA family ATPase n=1 Tax=Pseudomonas sp. PS02290 TaxID=2991430 RepID=UPI00249A8628|nr:AAA family ATPase [Pseudomonas sp. PS02290]
MAIWKIHGSHGDRDLNINLNGKDLIVTGINGSGKTFFLKELFQTAKNHVETNQPSLSTLEEQLAAIVIPSQNSGISRVSAAQQESERLKALIESLKRRIIIEIPEQEVLRRSYWTRKSVVLFFQAARASNIRRPTGAAGIDVIKEQQQKTAPDKYVSDSLEEHLVNLKNRHALAIVHDKNQPLADALDKWIRDFESNLSELMEDASAKLVFNSSHLKFTITRDNLPTTDFQNLSSGYSAIFAVYAELLVRTAYFEVSPNEMRGIVIIDELDAHLHVSLQRMILPFLKTSFPLIQFIVSTHSPFIITSVKDAVIYDVGRNEVIDDDISMYSYSSVMEGLLGTPPTSRVLEKTIEELALETHRQPPNTHFLHQLISKLEPSSAMLDVTSRAYFEAARLKLSDMSEE